MAAIVELGMLVAVVALFAGLGRLAWLAEGRLLRWGGMAVAALVASASLVAFVVAAIGLYRTGARTAPVPQVSVAGTPEQIRRGHAIADSFCAGCHTRGGTLTGGFDVGGELPLPVGSFVAANLTPAGALRDWSDGEIFRAIRNGVDAHGRWLVMMSYTNAGKLSDEDTLAVIAYLRSLPALGVATGDPPDRLTLLGLVMLGSGLLPRGKPVHTGAVLAPAKAPTAAYGEYILSYQDCRECHGADLTGGVPGQLPPVGPDLTVVQAWDLPEFIATMRTGRDPGGRQLNEVMPWRAIGRMDDEELSAVYRYLRQMPGSGG